MRFGIALLMVGLLALSATVLWRSSEQAISATDISPEHELVFFSAPWCGYCDRARAWFDEQRIDYLEIDVESSTEANRLWRQAGGRGVPHV
ncbi:MAG: glutaredoxin family protein, partial [Wenzhouxiangella sp.]